MASARRDTGFCRWHEASLDDGHWVRMKDGGCCGIPTRRTDSPMHRKVVAFKSCGKDGRDAMACSAPGVIPASRACRHGLSGRLADRIRPSWSHQPVVGEDGGHLARARVGGTLAMSQKNCVIAPPAARAGALRTPTTDRNRCVMPPVAVRARALATPIERREVRARTSSCS